MADRRMRVRRAAARLGGVFAGVAVHMIEPFGFAVERLQIVVADLPGRRDAAVVLDLAEVFLAQSEQRRAEKFGVAADVIVGVRMKLLAVLVVPFFFGLIFSLEIDRARVPVVFFSRHVVAALEDENLLAARRKLVGEGPAAGAAADDNNVVMIALGHGVFPEGLEVSMRLLRMRGNLTAKSAKGERSSGEAEAQA